MLCFVVSLCCCVSVCLSLVVSVHVFAQERFPSNKHTQSLIASMRQLFECVNMSIMIWLLTKDVDNALSALDEPDFQDILNEQEAFLSGAEEP